MYSLIPRMNIFQVYIGQVCCRTGTLHASIDQHPVKSLRNVPSELPTILYTQPEVSVDTRNSGAVVVLQFARNTHPFKRNKFSLGEYPGFFCGGWNLAFVMTSHSLWLREICSRSQSTRLTLLNLCTSLKVKARSSRFGWTGPQFEFLKYWKVDEGQTA